MIVISLRSIVAISGPKFSKGITGSGNSRKYIFSIEATVCTSVSFGSTGSFPGNKQNNHIIFVKTLNEISIYSCYCATLILG